MKQIISSPAAPAALGPYSQAVRAGDFVFCSGQTGLEPATGVLREGVADQAEQVLDNLARGPGRGRRRVRRRREDHHFPDGHGGLSDGQCDLWQALLR